jgi:hypothetical protein
MPPRQGESLSNTSSTMAAKRIKIQTESFRPASLYGWRWGEGFSLHENLGQSKAKGIVKTIGLPYPKEVFSVPPTGIVANKCSLED